MIWSQILEFEVSRISPEYLENKTLFFFQKKELVHYTLWV